jgi:glucuronoarabinoxylan endo-1,4-beta-xylanase
MNHLPIRLRAALVVTLFTFPAGAQTVTIDWTNLHQTIDGFGGADAQLGASLSSANQALLFGTGSGQLGYSILRTGVTDGAGDPGDCSSVSMSCAGVYEADMKAVVASGGRVYASPWSPPAEYKTNDQITCTDGAGLATSDYAGYATWLANYVTSVKKYFGITIFSMSVQNEPDQCQDYDSAIWSASDLDTFVKNNLRPTFASAGLTTLIFMPEGGSYYQTTQLGAACATDSACSAFVGGFNWHDYDGNVTGADTVNATPYPAEWASGKKFWETEASCGPGFGPNFCESGFNTDINDALDWGAIVDDRIAVEGANAWLYWWLVNSDDTDDQGLLANNGTVAKRAYMLAQYSRFVRPGYTRIDATHSPASGVSASAYRDTSGAGYAIVATNYNSSSASLTFSIMNAPALTSVIPWTTSGGENLSEGSSIPIAANSFMATLPSQSITTFVGTIPSSKDGGVGSDAAGASDGAPPLQDAGKQGGDAAREDATTPGKEGGVGEVPSSSSGCSCRTSKRVPAEGALIAVGVGVVLAAARRRWRGNLFWRRGRFLAPARR